MPQTQGGGQGGGLSVAKLGKAKVGMAKKKLVAVAKAFTVADEEEGCLHSVYPFCVDATIVLLPHRFVKQSTKDFGGRFFLFHPSQMLRIVL